MQIGALTAYMTYLIQILMAVMMATFMAIMIPRAAVSSDRIGEVLGTDVKLREPNSIQPEPIAAMKVTAAQKIDLFDAAGKAELY